METTVMDIHDMNKLMLSLELSKNVITKDYLCKLSEYEVADIPEKLKQLDISEYTRMFKFKKMVYDKNENVIDKLVTVLNAAYSSKATVVTLISGHKFFTEYYVGIVGKDIEQRRKSNMKTAKFIQFALLLRYKG